MGIQPGSPSVIQLTTSAAFDVGIVLGFFVAIVAAFAFDKLGNFMFRRGYAKPFYVFGRRMHHIWVYVLVPLGYLVLAYLVISGEAQLIRHLLWDRVALVMPVVGFCVAVDFIGDSWKKGGSTGILRHEWVYALIPAYIFTFVVSVPV